MVRLLPFLILLGPARGLTGPSPASPSFESATREVDYEADCNEYGELTAETVSSPAGAHGRAVGIDPATGWRQSVSHTITAAGQTFTASLSFTRAPLGRIGAIGFGADGEVDFQHHPRLRAVTGWDLRDDTGTPLLSRRQLLDGLDRFEHIVFSDGQGAEIGRLSYERDERNGRVARKTLLDGRFWTYDYDPDTGALTNAQLHAADGSPAAGGAPAAEQGAGGVGGLLGTVTTRPDGSREFRVALLDHLGSKVGELGPDGQVRQLLYGPFGEPLQELDGPGYSTKMWIPELRVYYYGHRYYNPAMGRWLSRDPIAEDGGLNLYGFVLNNPVNRYDVLGLDDIRTLGSDWVVHMPENFFGWDLQGRRTEIRSTFVLEGEVRVDLTEVQMDLAMELGVPAIKYSTLTHYGSDHNWADVRKRIVADKAKFRADCKALLEGLEEYSEHTQSRLFAELSGNPKCDPGSQKLLSGTFELAASLNPVYSLSATARLRKGRTA